jgi:hypothetical protein
MRIDANRPGHSEYFWPTGSAIHAELPVCLHAAYLSARDHASGDEGGRLCDCEHLRAPRHCRFCGHGWAQRPTNSALNKRLGETGELLGRLERGDVKDGEIGVEFMDGFFDCRPESERIARSSDIDDHAGAIDLIERQIEEWPGRFVQTVVLDVIILTANNDIANTKIPALAVTGDRMKKHLRDVRERLASVHNSLKP